MSLGISSRLKHPKKHELVKSHSQAQILANKLRQDGVLTTGRESGESWPAPLIDAFILSRRFQWKMFCRPSIRWQLCSLPASPTPTSPTRTASSTCASTWRWGRVRSAHFHFSACRCMAPIWRSCTRNSWITHLKFFGTRPKTTYELISFRDYTCSNWSNWEPRDGRAPKWWTSITGRKSTNIRR